MNKITPEIARRLRDRGLTLPVTSNYDRPELAKIAREQKILMDQIDTMDEQIRQMCQKNKEEEVERFGLYRADY